METVRMYCALDSNGSGVDEAVSGRGDGEIEVGGRWVGVMDTEEGRRTVVTSAAGSASG
jgi:hypothetical protein